MKYLMSYNEGFFDFFRRNPQLNIAAKRYV